MGSTNFSSSWTWLFRLLQFIGSLRVIAKQHFTVLAQYLTKKLIIKGNKMIESVFFDHLLYVQLCLKKKEPFTCVLSINISNCESDYFYFYLLNNGIKAKNVIFPTL